MSRGIVLALVAAYALVVAAVVAAVGWTHHQPYPCRATFERVQEGMTRAEVEATVGGPPGDYRSRESGVTSLALPARLGEVKWVCDETELWVGFGERGTALSVTVGSPNLWPSRTRCERVWLWATTGY